MTDIVGTLISICELARSGSKLLEGYNKKKLSAAEKELLIAADEQKGEIGVLHVDEIGYWIRIGRKDFHDEGDPAIATKYLDALRSLCKRGYIRPESGTLFKLTSEGFEKARQLATAKQPVKAF